MERYGNGPFKESLHIKNVDVSESLKLPEGSRGYVMEWYGMVIFQDLGMGQNPGT